MLNPNIFREYDIRGKVEQDLTGDTPKTIGKAFGTYLRRKGVDCAVIGMDNRPSSTSIGSLFIEGLRSTGCNCIDIGVTATPVLYFAMHFLGIKGGSMVTASHLPSNWNGFKLCYGPGTLYGSEIQKIREISEEGDFEEGNGKLSLKDVTDAYLSTIKDKVSLGPRKIRVVLDGGNGIAGSIGLPILIALGADVIPLYCTSDPRFPHHHPDPTKLENLRDLREMVLKEKADIGIALDGDGDRIGVLSEKGEIIWGDMLMILYSRDLLKRRPGSKIILDVKCSQILADEIKNLGGIPIWSPTGHSLIKARMREEGALIAGEMSGHMFFADDYFGYDDAIYAAARLLKILSESEIGLHEMLSDLPTAYSTPEIRPYCPDSMKFQVVEELKEKLGSMYESVTIDGIRFKTEDGWGLIRASNTQEALIVRCESFTREGLERLKGIIEDALKPYPEVKLDWESQGD